MQERMEKSFSKKLDKDTKSAQLDLNRLRRREFACEADARKEAELWRGSHPFHNLAMIMVLCLLVYSFAEWVIRKGLKQTGQSLLDQKGRPTQRPTLKWICFLFYGEFRKTQFNQKL